MPSPSPSVSAPPPRRSLRLEGAASLTTPTAGSSPAPDGASSGSGSGLGGKRRDRPRVSAPAAAASPKGGELGSDGVGGSEVRVSGGCYGGGSSGEGAFVSFRSGSRIAKRPMEPDVQMSGEMGLGSGGGVGTGDQVHDEMLHRDAKGTAKRCKSILVGGIEMEYDDDEDCILLSMRMPMQSSTAPNVIESNVVPMSTYISTDERRINDPVQTGKEHSGEFSSRKKDLLNGESMHLHNSLEMSVDGMIKPLGSPIGIPATDEVYVDMYFKEEIRRYESRKGGRGKGKLVLGNNNSGVSATVGIQGDARTRKFSPDDKGKGKMVVEENSYSRSSSDDEMVLEPVVSEEIQSISRAVDAPVEPLRRQAARERAIALAPKFAFFKADEDAHSDDDDAEDSEPVADPQDWPGPFSTAMRIIDDRDAKLRARGLNPSKLDKSADKVILWTHSKDRKAPSPPRHAPSLTSLCLQTLSNHAEGIESLAGIPEELKQKLLTSLCHSRKMNKHLLEELLCDNPVTLQLSECSWLGEDEFETIFRKCKTEFLQVLQLDLSGRCMPDYILHATLAKAPNCMPLLTKISLKGNYRLSDNVLHTISSAAPSLSSLSLCECSLLTSTGIENLANKLHSILRELYINDCKCGGHDDSSCSTEDSTSSGFVDVWHTTRL